MEKKAKKKITFLFKVGISGGLLWFLFARMETERIASVISGLRFQFLLMAFITFILSQAISTFRWKALLRGQVPYGRLFSLYFIGSFFNNFLPTAIGGDVVKTYYLYQEERDLGRSTVAVFMDRYVGMSGLLFIGIVGLILGKEKIPDLKPFLVYSGLVGVFLFSSVVLWKMRWDRWIRRARIFRDPLLSYMKEPLVLWKTFVLSVIIQLLVSCCVYMVAEGLQTNVEFKYFIAFVPLANVISMIPVTVSGIGVRESAMAYLFGLIGLSLEQAVSISLLWYALVVLASLIGGIEYLRLGSLQKKKVENVGV